MASSSSNARLDLSGKTSSTARDTGEYPEWDSPTDILYHHADNEDARIIPPIASKRPFVPPRKVPVHPMLAHQPYTAYVRPSVAFKCVSSHLRFTNNSLTTWDSPTDHIYSHAEEDCPRRSAM
jgi:hypothetical protein